MDIALELIKELTKDDQMMWVVGGGEVVSENNSKGIKEFPKPINPLRPSDTLAVCGRVPSAVGGPFSCFTFLHEQLGSTRINSEWKYVSGLSSPWACVLWGPRSRREVLLHLFFSTVLVERRI